MTIQVLGSGCTNCKKLYEVTKEVVEALDNKVKLEYLDGIEGTGRMIELGVMSGPVIAVDGKVALVGFTSDKKKITQAISSVVKTE
jgi:small redox-active disulfide protein 2